MDTNQQPLDGRAQLAEYIQANYPTQSAFAREIGCSESHLSLVLKGERGMSFGLAKRISEESGIPVEALPHEKAASAEAPQ